VGSCDICGVRGLKPQQGLSRRIPILIDFQMGGTTVTLCENCTARLRRRDAPQNFPEQLRPRAWRILEEMSRREAAEGSGRSFGNDMLSISEVARDLGVTEWTIRRWVRQGTLRKVRLAGKVWIPAEDVAKLKERETRREWLNTAEAASLAEVPLRTLWEWLRNGSLRGKMENYRYRIHYRELCLFCAGKLRRMDLVGRILEYAGRAEEAETWRGITDTEGGR